MIKKKHKKQVFNIRQCRGRSHSNIYNASCTAGLMQILHCDPWSSNSKDGERTQYTENFKNTDNVLFSKKIVCS